MNVRERKSRVHVLSICGFIGASLAQDRGRMESRIEALTAEVSELQKECQVVKGPYILWSFTVQICAVVSSAFGLPLSN